MVDLAAKLKLKTENTAQQFDRLHIFPRFFWIILFEENRNEKVKWYPICWPTLKIKPIRSTWRWEIEAIFAAFRCFDPFFGILSDGCIVRVVVAGNVSNKSSDLKTISPIRSTEKWEIGTIFVLFRCFDAGGRWRPFLSSFPQFFHFFFSLNYQS